MRTWSVERAITYAGTAAAVAVHSLFEQLWPAQAVRVALDRDYDRQVRKIAAAQEEADWYRERAEYLADYITADELAQVEEQQDHLEPGDMKVCVQCSGRDNPAGVEANPPLGASPGRPPKGFRKKK